MKKNLKKIIAVLLTSAAMVTTLAGCGSSKTDNSEVATITYAIWDKNQEPGMRAIADAFEAKNPDIKVNIEVTNWDQYWTKLEAAATGGALPDVFWMHSNNFVKYASSGMLMDITDRIKASKDVDLNNFPKGLVDATVQDGKTYGLPKDYDTIGLWYNKALFDKAKIAYPDATWDWNKLQTVAKQLTDTTTGVYGFAAPADAQQGYYNFIYQNGGNVISEDKKTSGFDSAATKQAIQFDVDFSLKDKSSPTGQQFADTSFGAMFQSGKVAMGLFGSWMVSEFKANDYVKANCDVAVIPQGKQKATIYNGLQNAVAAKTKYPEQSWKFLEFMGTKEANLLQAEKGAAIPAFKDTAQPWVDYSKEFNLKVYPEMLSYAVPVPTSKTATQWKEYENNILKKVWSKELTVEEGCNQLAKQMNETLATEK